MAVTFSSPPINRNSPALQARAGRISAMLPDLLVAAKRTANTLAQGLHGRRKSGPGEAFWQYRQFATGDSASHIDWRKSARSHQLYVRENEWEAAHTIWFWPDISPSMQLLSSMAEHTKAERAILLSLALAYLLTGAGEMVGAYGSQHPPGLNGRAVEQMAHGFLHQSAAMDKTPGQLPRPSQCAKAFSDAVFFSDFLGNPGEIKAALSAIAGTGVRGHMVQILDPAEETLPFSGHVEFADPASGRKLRVLRAQNLRDAYRLKLAEHRDKLRNIAARLGWSFTLHHTDTSPESALLNLHNILSRGRG